MKRLDFLKSLIVAPAVAKAVVTSVAKATPAPKPDVWPFTDWKVDSFKPDLVIIEPPQYNDFPSQKYRRFDALMPANCLRGGNIEPLTPYEPWIID